MRSLLLFAKAEASTSLPDGLESAGFVEKVALVKSLGAGSNHRLSRVASRERSAMVIPKLRY